MRSGPKIAALATAVPEFRVTQKEAANYLLKHFPDELGRRGRLLLKRVFDHPSIETRHFAIEDAKSFFREDPDARIARFTERALELSCRALEAAMDGCGLSARELKGLVLNTCTGYICPGLSTYMIERLGLKRDIKAFDLVGAGCAGALPNIELAGMIVNDNPGGAVACVSVEICSATFEMRGEMGGEAGDDPSLIVSNALFSDGAAAAILWDRPHGMEVVSSSMRFAPELREAIRYVHRGGRLVNQLSMDLPRILREPVKASVLDTLAGVSLGVEDIDHWAIHAGGEKIIGAIMEAIGLPVGKTIAARKVLKEHGNMSSPTVWFVLDELLRQGFTAGEYCAMVSFGAGLSAHCALLLNRGMIF